MKRLASISKSNTAAGFTMVEIAIALAVIAFALIAIIGVLPTGLQVNRDNREETLIDQDARLLIEAIRNGTRGTNTDLGSYVTHTNDANGVAVPVRGIPTINLIQLLCDTNRPHEVILSSISGALANQGSDLAFRYQVRSLTTNAIEFANTPLSNQTYEVRLRFAWPVLPDNSIRSEANSYVARTFITGSRTNDVFYAQQHSNQDR
jgi:type II secretory pathway pseudopilin PulG